MRVFVAGGTGFVGTHVVKALLAADHEVVALARDLKAFDWAQGRVAVVQGDVAVPFTYRGRALHCQAAINCVGLLRERWYQRNVTFERVVVRGTEAFVQECKEAGIKHVIQVSANGADSRGTKYQRTKWIAEQKIRQSGLAWTIFRPSLVFGPPGVGSGMFAEQLAGLLRLKVVPVFGRQDYYFEPVDVHDVAAAVVGALTKPQAKDRVFHVGGPEQFTYRELLEHISRASARKALLIPAPKFAGYLVAALLGWLPFFPATVANLRMLFRGNICPEDDWTKVFNIQPRRFPETLPRYLEQRNP